MQQTAPGYGAARHKLPRMCDPEEESGYRTLEACYWSIEALDTFLESAPQLCADVCRSFVLRQRLCWCQSRSVFLMRKNSERWRLTTRTDGGSHTVLVPSMDHTSLSLHHRSITATTSTVKGGTPLFSKVLLMERDIIYTSK